MLKEHFDREDLRLLGDFDDCTVTARLPAYPDRQSPLHDAISTYRHNATFNMLSSKVPVPKGDTSRLFDEDVGLYNWGAGSGISTRPRTDPTFPGALHQAKRL